MLRPTLRNILGQSTSTIDFQQIIDNNRILLVSLSKGQLGEDTSQLLGSFIVSRLWQAALARANRLKLDRPDFNLYLDEFHNYLHLPQSLDEILAESRAYRLNLTLANQSRPTVAALLRGQAVRPRTAWKIGRALSQATVPSELPGLLEAS